ncbi:MAG: hypothetical protein JXQ23_05820 [Clostridia bacterium]|nr:hypothetical protein [Clostridia bacterium]
MDNDSFYNIIEELIDRNANSDFYNLSEQDKIRQYLIRSMNFQSVFDGGFPGAERKILKQNEKTVLTVLRVTFKKGVEFSHSDILGSLLSLGLDRKKTGDIIINGQVAYVIIKEEVASYLCLNLQKVGNATVSTEIISLTDIIFPEISQEEKIINVSSLRLDSVLSGGFHLARNKSVDFIKAQKVSVNQMLATKASSLLKENDIVSIRGRGRLVIKGIHNTTKKGRLNIKVIIQH